MLIYIFRKQKINPQTSTDKKNYWRDTVSLDTVTKFIILYHIEGRIQNIQKEMAESPILGALLCTFMVPVNEKMSF